ncbi:MAG TPA: hypothetical protein VIF59_16890 [Methylomirabilota bacterium]|jgi:hypothetical protein
MVTTRTASRTHPRRLAALAAIVAFCFLAGQSSALAHEIEHVLRLHDAPCALHVAADHLVMASAAEPTPAVTLAPSPGSAGPPAPARLARPFSPTEARAPPLLP